MVSIYSIYSLRPVCTFLQTIITSLNELLIEIYAADKHSKSIFNPYIKLDSYNLFTRIITRFSAECIQKTGIRFNYCEV